MVASLYGADEETKAIWVYLEHKKGKLAGVSLELLSKGRQLADQGGWSLVGLLFGHEIRALTEEAFAYGAEEIRMAEHPLLEPFTVEAHAHAVYGAILQGKPSILLFGATSNGRDLAGRLAVRLRTGLNADCTDLRLDLNRGVLVSEVSGFGGGVLALLEMPNHRPQMATARPGVFQAEQIPSIRKDKVVEIPLAFEPGMIRTRVVEQVVGEGIDLTQVPVLVCGGRGIEGDFAMLEELARLYEGEVGATRPPVDEGHIGRERQIGQTGVIAHPKLAFACGISGAFHFVVGIQDAETIVAINSDPEAPIFEFSDYCLVGDAAKIIPALIDESKREREAAHA
jgi:electron transfer flavoprotein alpha subunit